MTGEGIRDHLPVAGLEDVQGKWHPREEDGVGEGKERKEQG
jgi:hypothetical protein